MTNGETFYGFWFEFSVKDFFVFKERKLIFHSLKYTQFFRYILSMCHGIVSQKEWIRNQRIYRRKEW